ncbi:MAG: D-alanine--D-alanine ligase [Verrucomicrobiota bacterium]|nr:D-alanine--D-alanine ligase [Verrucomicrobiota bacterium]
MSHDNDHRFKKVAVLMGGPSAEREVSLRSGTAVAAALERRGYAVVAVDVTDHTLNLPAGTEAVFIAMHGEFGEDGMAQNLLERRGIPYTGSGPRSSAVSFDKVQSKKILVKQGIATPEYEVLRAGDRRTLSLPLVTKPARQGSSIGAHRVFDEAGWDPAIRDTFLYDREAIVERYIAGREMTVGIVGDEALPVIEIRAPDEWYSYAAKYTKGRTEYLVPTPIGEQAARQCRTLALNTFRSFGARGFARVDLRLSIGGRACVLELNSIPGFTETSLLPKAAAQAGMDFEELCDRILRAAACGVAEAIADAG